MNKIRDIINNYQCDGCLKYFSKEEVAKECECGAYLCKECKSKNYIVSCYCDC